MKDKKAYIVFSVVQLLLLVAGYFVQRLSVTRMGMMRHVLFYNQAWEAKLPIPLLVYAVVFIVLIVMTAIFFRYFGSARKDGGFKRFLLVELNVLSVAYGLFLINFSSMTLRAYYFVAMIFATVWVLGVAKILICMHKATKNDAP